MKKLNRHELVKVKGGDDPIRQEDNSFRNILR